MYLLLLTNSRTVSSLLATLVCEVFADIKLLVVLNLLLYADFKNAYSFAVSDLIFFPNPYLIFQT